MNRQNDKDDRSDSMENLESEATCAAGCDCNAGDSGGRARWITGLVILVVAGGLVARAMIKNNGAKNQEDKAIFAVVMSPTDASPQFGTSEPVTEGAKDEVRAIIAGKEIATLSDLNKLAADTDGVFIYMPGKDTYTKNDAPEYTSLASQMAVPGVIVMVKGKGIAPVTGNITENSLIQSFVAASSSGGCGPASAGCGPSGCN